MLNFFKSPYAKPAAMPDDLETGTGEKLKALPGNNFFKTPCVV